VYIEPGTFTMGSPSSESGRDDDETQHQVTLTKGYYMQTTEVTQSQWKAVMGSNPSHFPSCGDNCPIERISWNSVQKFITALNEKEKTDQYRLPTEAEWEYAARAGSTTAFANTDISEAAWYYGNAGFKTHLVAQKQANAWGLFDMHGNVWEWCHDWYGDYPTNAVTDPEGLTSGTYRVIRGGDWGYAVQECRSANRSSLIPSGITGTIGLRLSRTL